MSLTDNSQIAKLVDVAANSVGASTIVFLETLRVVLQRQELQFDKKLDI